MAQTACLLEPNVKVLPMIRWLATAILAALAFDVSAGCSNTSYGSGVTCIKSAGVGGSQTNQTTKDLSFSPTAGHAVIVTAYQCWDSNCQHSGSATMAISDNVNTPETCFTRSPRSPFTLVETGAQTIQQYMWYCPSIPSGVNNIRLTCSPAN